MSLTGAPASVVTFPLIAANVAVQANEPIKSGTRVSNICRGTRPGSSANTALRERRNTILPTCPPRRACECSAIIKARWICEQAHQQLKEELGLDHFEGRSWQGLHRHALMTMIAYAFLQHRRLIRAKREKKNQRTTTSAKLASRAPRYCRSHHATASAVPELPTMGPRGIARKLNLPM